MVGDVILDIVEEGPKCGQRRAGPSCERWAGQQGGSARSYRLTVECRSEASVQTAELLASICLAKECSEEEYGSDRRVGLVDDRIRSNHSDRESRSARLGGDVQKPPHSLVHPRHFPIISQSSEAVHSRSFLLFRPLDPSIILLLL